MATYKVLHVPFCYFPDAVGGTEIYVRDLAREQIGRGYQVQVMAPAARFAVYQHDGITVTRFKVTSEVADVRDLYSSEKTDTAEFLAAIARFRPDVLHIHGTGRAISPQALRRARELGAALVLTYHTPTTTCIRGTLLRNGADPCDGVLDAGRCAACVLTMHGVPAPVAALVARTPAAASTLVRATGARGRLATALRMRELVTVQHEQTRELLDVVDHVVAPAEWVADLLVRLGVARERVSLSRQGIRRTAPAHARIATDHDAVRLVYLGRLEAGKGIQLVLDAMQKLPQLALELHIFGVVQGDSQAAYRTGLAAAAARDTRVHLHEPIAPDDVVDTLAQYDVLVAPSQQFETGPLVVLEAFAAGIPVIGSRLGGIEESIRADVDGILVDRSDADGWVGALRQVSDPAVRRRLAAGIERPRSMRAVADDMQRIYDTLVGPA